MTIGVTDIKLIFV